MSRWMKVGKILERTHKNWHNNIENNVPSFEKNVLVFRVLVIYPSCILSWNHVWLLQRKAVAIQGISTKCFTCEGEGVAWGGH